MRPAPPVTILVAEDDPLGALLARQVLAGAGWTVEIAVDGVEAIEALRASPERYALALLDLMMPRADAIAVIDATRMLRPDLPILLTSGYAEGFVRERLGGRTIQGFLPKPWDLPLLIEAVRRGLGAVT
jgi:two-component system cell cycle sensor histidine kinase/response regulator CckA